MIRDILSVLCSLTMQFTAAKNNRKLVTQRLQGNTKQHLTWKFAILWLTPDHPTRLRLIGRAVNILTHTPGPKPSLGNIIRRLSYS